MSKGHGVIVGIIVVILIIVVFWAFRGRPAGDQTGPLVTPPDVTQTPLVSGQTPVAGGLGEVALPTATPAQSGAQVTIASTSFSPTSVTVPVGGSVTFTNADTESHRVSSNPHPIHTNFRALNIVVLAPGASGTVVFNRAGTFGYHDHPNPGLTGTVIVQ